DNYLAVRGGTVVIACDGNVRSCLSAGWLSEMGFPRVFALDGGTTSWVAAGGRLEAGASPTVPFGYAAARAQVKQVSSPALAGQLRTAQAPRIIFVGTSE